MTGSSVVNSISECTRETRGDDFDGSSEDQDACQKSGEQVQEVIESLSTGLVEGDARPGPGGRTTRAQCTVLYGFEAAGKRQMVPEVGATVPVGLVRRSTAFE